MNLSRYFFISTIFVGTLLVLLKFDNSLFPQKFSTKINSFPTISRVVYLFLCEGQAEVDTYSKVFPSVSADAVFYCWKENCNLDKFRNLSHIYSRFWPQSRSSNVTFISSSSSTDFIRVEPKVYVINEKDLKLGHRSTWTTARNSLYEFAVKQEMKQLWRWAFYTFADGDVHCACPLAEQIIKNKSIVDYGNNEEHLISPILRTFVNLAQSTNDEETCFLLFDAFLLRFAPAIATISGTGSPMAYPGLLAQVVYHIDAMLNAVHRDALQFVVPYCPRYDDRSWWTSQAIFVYRSLCLYGHVLQFDAVHVVRQSHRQYPRSGSPWNIDGDMNLFPDYLTRLQQYMKQSRFVSILLLHNYPGWNMELSSDTCRRQHTTIDLKTCLVGAQKLST